jgi:hypothetical protein
MNMSTTTRNANGIEEQSAAAVTTEGEAALREALAAEGLEYALGRCLEEYALALDGARRASELARLGSADQRAFLAHVDTTTRAQLVTDALARRDQAVYRAHRQLVEWRRTFAARERSMPQAFHEFADS